MTPLTSVSLAVFLVSLLQVSMCPAARRTTSGAGQGSGQDTDPSFHLATASPWSHSTHRVHKGDAKDVIAEEEQLLLHQTPLVINLDLLWQRAEGWGKVQQEGSERPRVWAGRCRFAPFLWFLLQTCSLVSCSIWELEKK